MLQRVYHFKVKMLQKGGNGHGGAQQDYGQKSRNML